MRLPVLVTEYIPAARLAVFSTPINAFLSAGCPRDQAVMAAAEVERTGACTAVPATAVALPLAPFVAARFDPDGDELAAVVPCPTAPSACSWPRPASPTQTPMSSRREWQTRLSLPAGRGSQLSVSASRASVLRGGTGDRAQHGIEVGRFVQVAAGVAVRR